MKVHFALPVLTVLCALPAGAQNPATYMKIISPELPPGTRLMGFSFIIESGRVAVLREAPAGWRIAIDNDPSWRARITANAVVGAAALKTEDLASLFLLAQTPTENRLGQSETKVSGSVDVMKNGDIVTVSEPSLRLQPASAADH